MYGFEDMIKYLESMKDSDFQEEIAKAKTDRERNLLTTLYEYYYGRYNPPIVYHYTDFVALEGILFQMGIRLCRADDMNDKAEMRNFIDLAEKSVIKRIGHDKVTIAEIKDRFRKEHEKRKGDIAYLASFSSLRDNAAQWERYGGNGRGVSIGFDAKILRDIAQEKSIILQEVFYGENADNHKIVDVLEDLFLNKDNVRHGFYRDDWEAIFDSAWGVSVAHKNHSFHTEQEFRLVTLPSWRGNRYDKLGDLHMVVTPYAFRECLYLDWRDACKNLGIPIEKLIVKIIIGPRSKISKKGLQKWLVKNGMLGMDNCIEISNSTLR